MTIELTRPAKQVLTVDIPVMAASGILGFGDHYRDLIDFKKLGAFVTNAVTYEPRRPANGRRVQPIPTGTLIHTGLPNPGISKIMAKYRQLWETLPLPVILHIAVTSLEHARKCASRAEAESAIDAIELGFDDEQPWQETEEVVAAVVKNTEKPVLVRVPFIDPLNHARAAADAGAGGVVVCAPPRGTVMPILEVDPTGMSIYDRPISGRIYGPLTKPIVLRFVEQVVQQVKIPVIACGGIHREQDARDFLQAGARAVQVDSVVWVKPTVLELIARDLGGLVLTRPMGALADEWHRGYGQTEQIAREESQRRRHAQNKS